MDRNSTDSDSVLESISLDEGLDPSDDETVEGYLDLACQMAQGGCLYPDDVKRRGMQGRNTLISEDELCASCLARDALNHLKRAADKA